MVKVIRKLTIRQECWIPEYMTKEDSEKDKLINFESQTNLMAYSFLLVVTMMVI
jgi:hypothetical protein